VIELLPLLLGFLLDQLLGDPPGWPHPVRWIGRLIGFLEKLLRKQFPERVGGALLLVLVVLVTGGVVATALLLAERWHPFARLAIATLMVYYGLATRSLARETGAVLDALRANDLVDSRKRLSFIVGRDTADLPPEQICRACIETVAENTADGIVAPLFYAALAGPIGLWIYKAINTLDSMVGYKNARYRRFGTASARTDDLANYLPARLTWLLLSVAAGWVGGNMRQAFRIGWRDGRKHPSPNSAWSEAAMAGALGVQLGGCSTYQGVASEKPLLGDPGGPLTLAKAEQSIRMMLMAAWLALLFAVLLWLLADVTNLHRLGADLLQGVEQIFEDIGGR
jgi:adenosylcobinamide-phosphate synthase